jgi:hypothetical protein
MLKPVNTMDLVAVAALVLVPFIAGILVGWGVRSLMSMKRREHAYAFR